MCLHSYFDHVGSQTTTQTSLFQFHCDVFPSKNVIVTNDWRLTVPHMCPLKHYIKILRV